MGIDPGISGGIAVIDIRNNFLTLYDMPTYKVTKTKTKTYCDGPTISKIVQHHSPDICYLEEVWSSPQMGVRSAFSFGDNYGTIKGVLAGNSVKLSLVLPTIWKSDLKCPTNKQKAVLRARELFSGGEGALKKDGHSEAAMIGLWGCMDLGIIPDNDWQAEKINRKDLKI